MENQFSGKKPEDILTNDDLLESFNRCSESEIEKTKELQETRIIYNSIQSHNKRLKKKEKISLEYRITNSILKYKKNRLLLWLSASAATILLVMSIFIFRQESENDITKFANNIETGPATSNTRLILNGKKEILIGSKESKIEYANSGKEIKIDASKKIKQTLEQDIPVFNTIIVPYGKRTQITLSDSSTIWLNSGSKLIYPAHFSKSKREVYLEGEGMFEVTHNKKSPFHVITRDIEIKVLGTVFNISAYIDDKHSTTVLESGSVELKYKSNALLKQSKVDMIPGTKAVYNPETKVVEQTKVDTQDYTCWREGYIILHNESLQDITKKLSRYYNVPITFKNDRIKTKTFSGRLDLKNSALIVLQIIAETTNFSLITNDDQIIIN